MAKASDLNVGSFIRMNNELTLITEFIHRTPGNLRAFYQAKMRVLRTGKQTEYRFRTDEEVEIVRVEERDLQYLYKQENNLVCMDTETFEQYEVPEEAFGNAAPFLKESMMVRVAFDGLSAVSATPPKSVDVEVTYTEPGLKGDTATRALKQATVETGAIVMVPLFIDNGEMIRVNPATGEYIERVK
jgi:elongation factor P